MVVKPKKGFLHDLLNVLLRKANTDQVPIQLGTKSVVELNDSLLQILRSPIGDIFSCHI
jgi:hypothetical protein